MPWNAIASRSAQAPVGVKFDARRGAIDWIRLHLRTIASGE
jgi:hypothetical protein